MTYSGIFNEVDFDKKDNQLDMFNNECEGLYGI